MWIPYLHIQDYKLNIYHNYVERFRKFEWFQVKLNDTKNLTSDNNSISNNQDLGGGGDLGCAAPSILRNSLYFHRDLRVLQMVILPWVAPLFWKYRNTPINKNSIHHLPLFILVFCFNIYILPGIGYIAISTVCMYVNL